MEMSHFSYEKTSIMRNMVLKASVRIFKAQRTECIITSQIIFHCKKIFYERNSSLTRIALFATAILGLHEY